MARPSNGDPAIHILRRAAVEQRTGLTRSTIYALIARGAFPKPIALTKFRVGWIDAEITAWIAARVAERDAPQASRGRRQPISKASSDAEANTT